MLSLRSVLAAALVAAPLIGCATDAPPPPPAPPGADDFVGSWNIRLTDVEGTYAGAQIDVEKEGGGYAYHHDPAIGDALRAAGPMVDYSCWEYWDRMACPVLVMRGAQSHILPAETAEEMMTRGPGNARAVELIAENECQVPDFRSARHLLRIPLSAWICRVVPRRIVAVF